jgi:hypothetical protein
MTHFTKKIRKHLREGTLWWLFRSKYINRFLPEPVSRWNLKTIEQAESLLRATGAGLAGQFPGKAVLVIGDPGPRTDRILTGLRGANVSLVECLSCDPPREVGLSAEAIGRAGSVLIVYPDVRRITLAARALMRHPTLANLRTEYAIAPDAEYKELHQWGRFIQPCFISPQLSEPVDIHGLYRESLTRFEQKCDIMDYLDLCALVRHVVSARVPGGIAEFGSYKGHSGYLISRYLTALKSDKHLHMFDMFEHFPEEITGVDTFWTGTHDVAFEEVKAKFSNLANTTLVRGDFTKSFDQTKLQQLSMVYIDCDSYRGTRYLLERLYESVLAPGGLVVIEDYGHTNLLGSRLAVDEFFESRTDCFQFFSHFSGFYIVAKR